MSNRPTASICGQDATIGDLVVLSRPDCPIMICEVMRIIPGSKTNPHHAVLRSGEGVIVKYRLK